MRNKTFLFIIILLSLVATAANAGTTTIWEASQAGGPGTDYAETVSSLPKSGTTAETSAFESSDENSYYYNTQNDEYYMYIKPAAFTSVKAGDKIGVYITYTSSNVLYFKNPGTDLTAPASCEEYTNISSSANNSWAYIDVTEDIASALKANGLYIGGTYFNRNKVAIETIDPVVIAEDVKKEAEGIPDPRYFKEAGMKMADTGYANIKYSDSGQIEYEECGIVNGSSYEISAEDLTAADVKSGDTLLVFIENAEELDYSDSKHENKEDKETTNGTTGAWAGLCVGDGWLAPKFHCFPIKGHFYQVLNEHMASLIRKQGLTIKGCKFQLDYIVIEKRSQRSTTAYEIVETTHSLYDNSKGFTTNDNWTSGKPDGGLSIPTDITSISLWSEVKVTYTCSEASQIQLIAGSGCYGEITPDEGGKYTDISAATDGTVSFTINDTQMASDIKNNPIYFQTDKAITITKVELVLKDSKKGTTETISLTADNEGKWKWEIKELVTDKGLYWGNVIYVECTGGKPEVKIDNEEVTTLRGGFIKCNGNNDNEYFLYLDYKDSQNLGTIATSANTGTTETLEITAPAGGEITSVKILPETRQRNTRNIEVNGDVDWGEAERVQQYLGQVEEGDLITVVTEANGDNPQYQASIMHMNEKNTKGLAFNDVFKFAEIYDILKYSSNDEKAKEYISGSGNMTFQVENQYMANLLSKNPFTIAGQDLTVKSISVNGKAFVQPITIGYGENPVYWGTMCSPYNISIIKNSNVHAYIVTGVGSEMQDGVYPLTPKEITNIPAGTPVLIYKDEKVYGNKEDNFTFAIIDDKDEFTADDTSNNLLCGELEDKTITNTDSHTYYKLTYKADNSGIKRTAFFKIADSGVKTSANKAYLRLPKATAPNAKAFVLRFEDSGNETTGISGIENQDGTTKRDVYYNLNGQRIAAPTKGGIYIRNGKKIIIK